VALKLASHTVRGVAIGLAFALVLSLVDKYGVMNLIDHSADTESTIVFVGVLVLVRYRCDHDGPDFHSDGR
jgi:hypothetical protein